MIEIVTAEATSPSGTDLTVTRTSRDPDDWMKAGSVFKRYATAAVAADMAPDPFVPPTSTCTACPCRRGVRGRPPTHGRMRRDKGRRGPISDIGNPSAFAGAILKAALRA